MEAGHKWAPQAAPYKMQPALVLRYVPHTCRLLQDGNKTGEKVFVLCDRHCKGYYHWTHEQLPRLGIMYDRSAPTSPLLQDACSAIGCHSEGVTPPHSHGHLQSAGGPLHNTGCPLQNTSGPLHYASQPLGCAGMLENKKIKGRDPSPSTAPPPFQRSRNAKFCRALVVLDKGALEEV